MTISQFVKATYEAFIIRAFKLYRFFASSLNTVFIGEQETDARHNVHTFRKHVITMIEHRKQQMKHTDFVDKGDFMTMLLQDELFKNNDDIITDECLLFLFASTHSMSSTIANTLMNVMYDKQIYIKVKSEINSAIQ